MSADCLFVLTFGLLPVSSLHPSVITTHRMLRIKGVKNPDPWYIPQGVAKFLRLQGDSTGLTGHNHRVTNPAMWVRFKAGPPSSGDFYWRGVMMKRNRPGLDSSLLLLSSPSALRFLMFELSGLEAPDDSHRPLNKEKTAPRSISGKQRDLSHSLWTVYYLSLIHISEPTRPY